MKIAGVSLFSDFVGGGEHSLLDLLSSLASREEMILVTPGTGDLSRKAAGAGVVVAHLPMPPLGPASLPALWHWLAWLKKERPDMLHANNSRAAVYAGIAGRLLGIPMIFHCRIAERDARLDGLIGRLASRIICNSRAVAARFANRLDKLAVIYNGIPALEAVSAAKPWGAEAIMLFAGRLSEEKQADVALRVFRELADAFPGLHLAMAGGDDPLNPDYGERLRSEAMRASCAERIHWLGQCEDMAAWYAAAELLIVPSRHEGFGRVIVEAMGCGVPVVAFAVGGIPEVLQDGVQGLLIEPDDIAAMTNGVKRLLSDEGLRTAMGGKGKQRASLFSLDAHVAAVEQLYHALLNDG